MEIVDFNAMDADAAAAYVRPCASIGSFVSGLVTGRPYPDRTTLLAHAERLASEWTRTEVDEALADHPRIGERHRGTGASAAMSDAEQSGVASDDDVRRRLAEANRRYEERFGQVYLVRAKGRSAEELLLLLEQRLGNDDAAEAEVVHQQLTQIALLRLSALVEDAA